MLLTITKTIIFLVLFHHSTFAANFTCLNGDIVGALNICNGISNCADGSDERSELCSTIICQPQQFKCHYGGCVDRGKFCNKIHDCLDGSDEFNCGRSNKSCESTEFYCTSDETCIDVTLICNNYRDCPNGEDENVCQSQLCPKNSFRCSHGRCIDEKLLCDNFNDCITGDDESDLLCNAQVNDCYECNNINCPPINSNRLDIISCIYENETVSCEDNEIKPGTIVNYACKIHYEPINNIHKFNYQTTCQRNGQWSSEILKCTPKCGYLKNSISLIVNGFPTEELFPWHATIFIKRKSGFEFACGASLLSESTLVSASHCFNGLNESDVKIAVGKRYSNLEIQENEINAKIFNVSRIYRHPLYLDKIGNYGQDIALVELDEIIELSDDVHPICIDWQKNDDYLAENQLGIVVGMGITENETFSDVIRMASLKVIPTQDCINKQPKDFRKYITFTTFCAGTDNGTSVCNGDSGGGFVTLSRDKKKWLIRGIVSLSPRKRSTFFCDPHKYTIFTKIDVYVRWIKFILDSIEVRMMMTKKATATILENENFNLPVL
ncbi:hypothetical protein PVAND_010988 [Polypedilum vanderplanki]|uniref:Uncharacterized protein n=1 Tax=Polypedilum vanderplanki TaxID=319348 RepID=A0A9J6CH97_POLVA|nr:hypothetical protein PVAND_010988 [Polypedilum vanderplanki]